MRKIVAVSFLLGLCAFSSHAAEQPLAIAEKWALCVGQADVGCLQDLLSKNYRHTHGTALVENKTQFINALANGTRRYDPIYFEEVEVQTLGDTAIVLGKFNLRVVINGNTTLEAVNRFGMVIANTEQDAKILYFQATPIKPGKDVVHQ